MSIGRLSPPKELIESLRSTYGVTTFVETGTYIGRTAVWASKQFQKVYTVEFSKEIYDATSKEHGGVGNIEFHYGHSKEKLAEIVPKLSTPAIFWLDAHWSAGNTYGVGDECPLLEELEIIDRSPVEHFILVDDARMFLSPPPEPSDPAQWPGIASIVQALNARRDPYIVVVHDVIVAVPRSAQSIVMSYCQRANGELWKESKRSNLQRAISDAGTYVSRKLQPNSG